MSNYLEKLVATRGQGNVLDWGCGRGTAAKEVAKNKKLNVFGFSIDSSKEWLDPQGVTFLQTVPEVLPRFLKSNKIKLNLIYSERALWHMSIERQVIQFGELLPSLTIGGKIFPDPVQINSHQLKFLESKGYLVETKASLLFSLTRIK